MVIEQAYYFIFFALFLITGMCVGSFMNVVIYRLPLILLGSEDNERRFSLAWPPSHCPVCQGRIRFYDNIPVLSWLVLRGKCRYCRTPISAVYPLTEAITGLWFTGVYLSLNDPEITLLTLSGLASQLPLLALFCLLYCVMVIDIRYYLIPDVLSLGILWAGLVFSVSGLLSATPIQSVLGGVFAYSVLWLVQQGYRVIRGFEGLGRGDVKLFAAAGVWLGLNQVPWLILLSAVCGGVLYGVRTFYQKNSLLQVSCTSSEWDTDHSESDIRSNKLYIPFGPAIALAFLLLYLIQI
ncbi:prepilin peptidase [Proteus columbae]|uniref:prepilin peptidase n=2 Tax=Proteus columbae TaxID=1987580 RepID=UPI002889419C|nr:prepilin peptidase [Proteus columbae]